MLIRYTLRSFDHFMVPLFINYLISCKQPQLENLLFILWKYTSVANIFHVFFFLKWGLTSKCLVGSINSVVSSFLVVFIQYGLYFTMSNLLTLNQNAFRVSMLLVIYSLSIDENATVLFSFITNEL